MAKQTKGYVPPEAHCVRSLAFFIRNKVRMIRVMKHRDRGSIDYICECFPDVSREWICRIAFYQVWKLLEFETSVVTIMCDLYTVDATEVLDLASKFGFKLSAQDQNFILKYAPDYTGRTSS